jgi:hypothetical protein
MEITRKLCIAQCFASPCRLASVDKSYELNVLNLYVLRYVLGCCQVFVLSSVLYHAVNGSVKVLMLWMVELFGKLFRNVFVLALRMPNHLPIRFRIPKVTCRHLRLRPLKASGHHEPLSTSMRDLFCRLLEPYR